MIVAVEIERDCAFEAFDDRAFGAAVSLTGGGEVFQGLSHLVEMAGALLELGDVLQRDGLHLRAAAMAVAPQP